MAEVNLLVDIGNSTLHLALAEGTRIIWHEDLPAGSRKFEVKNLKTRGALITGVGIASVVPDFTPAFAELARTQLGLEPLIVSHKIRTGLRLDYRPRSSLGPDRIANAIAAHSLYPGNTIVVDMGTATTIEVVTREGVFTGGAIMPGLPLMLAALRLGTARLPPVKPGVPGRLPATGTVENIRAGAFHAHFAGINAAISGIQRETKRKYRIIATGGLSTDFGRWIHGVESVTPLLTLQGIAIALQLNSLRRQNG